MRKSYFQLTYCMPCCSLYTEWSISNDIVDVCFIVPYASTNIAFIAWLHCELLHPLTILWRSSAGVHHCAGCINSAKCFAQLSKLPFCAAGMNEHFSHIALNKVEPHLFLFVWFCLRFTCVLRITSHCVSTLSEFTTWSHNCWFIAGLCVCRCVRVSFRQSDYGHRLKSHTPGDDRHAHRKAVHHMCVLVSVCVWPYVAAM